MISNRRAPRDWLFPSRMVYYNPVLSGQRLLDL